MAHRVEASLAANLATKLRLTVRSTKDRYAPKAVNWPKPWKLPDDDPKEPPPTA